MTRRTVPRLAGRAELLKVLGVGGTRLRHLMTDPAYEFPKPVQELIGGNIWVLDDVVDWANKRGRVVDLSWLDGEHVTDS